MKIVMKTGSILTTVAVMLVAMAGGVAADPKEKQTQQIAIAGTVLSAYLLSKENTRTAGAVAAAGTAYAWKKHSDAVKQRNERERYGYYGGRSDSDYSNRGGGYDPYYDNYRGDGYAVALHNDERRKAEEKRQKSIQKANQKYQKDLQKSRQKAVKASNKRR